MIRTLLIVAAMVALGAGGAMLFRQADAPEAPAAAVSDPAPGFALTAQDGRTLSLADLRGKAVVVSFAYTACSDICPVAIYKLAWMQGELGEAFGRDVAFVTITVDPEHDTPEVLADYAGRGGADPAGWSFLTGEPDTVARVVRSYGVYARPAAEGGVDHILLTTLVDRDGIIRVQYLGERFDSVEMLGDVRALMAGREVAG